jgi:energy-coupling factor transporter transmembrane protein EcfT
MTNGTNPLIKAILLAILTILIFITDQLALLLLLLLYILLFFRIGRIKTGGLKWLVIPFLMSLPLTYLVFIVSYWIDANDFYTGFSRGVFEASQFHLRILILILANILFIKTTDTRQLVHMLQVIHIPEIFILVLATVFRFFPILIDEGRRIIEVQRTRGIRPYHLLRPHHSLPLLIPLFIINMQRAQEMALSVRLRGSFINTQKPEWQLNKQDLYSILGFTLMLVLILMLRG